MTTPAESITTDHIIVLMADIIHPDRPSTRLTGGASRLYMTIRIGKDATDQNVKDEVLQTVRALGEYLKSDTSPEFNKLVDTYTQAILNDRSEN